jgi:hypothetical protein
MVWMRAAHEKITHQIGAEARPEEQPHQMAAGSLTGSSCSKELVHEASIVIDAGATEVAFLNLKRLVEKRTHVARARKEKGPAIQNCSSNMSEKDYF